MANRRSPQTTYISGLVTATLVSIGLYAYGAVRNHDFTYSYLLWNLFLAWLPLLFALWIARILAHKLWSSWEGLAASLLWILFLPNSFYLISDYIHLQGVSRVDILYDVIMFTSFIFTGVVLGFSSLFLVQSQLLQRLSNRLTAAIIGATLFVCSIAIFIGRDLRWNSWDVLTNPGGLLFDISDRLVRPAEYPQMLLTIAGFFVLLSMMYFVVLQGIRMVRQIDLPLD